MDFNIEESYDDTRVDKYLRKKLHDKPLGEIFKLFRKGNVKINGKKAKENQRVFSGDIVSVYGVFKVEEIQKDYLILTDEERDFIKSNILFETEEILIFYKESGIVMHKGSNFDYGISEMLKSYYENDEFAFVNRIDKETSGLVLGSKKLTKTRELTEKIRDRNISKSYYVLVKGNTPEKFEIRNKLFLISNFSGILFNQKLQ